MRVELLRLAMGLCIFLFHRPIADYILERERRLVILFRQRGVPLPAAPTTETCRNVYFWLGAFVVVFQASRIWLAIHRS